MIPVLDFSQFDGPGRAHFLEAFGRACRETGFLIVTGHGVDRALIDAAFAAGDALFSLSPDDKAAIAISNSPHNRGYVGFGVERLDEASPQQDRKEAFNIGLDLSADDPRVLAGEAFRGVNLWPDLPAFRSTMLAYFDAVWDLGRRLHRAVALDLRLPETYFEAFLDQPMATLRLLRYPGGALDGGTGETGGLGAGAHTDYGSITLLTTDGVPGLQVRPRGGDWIDVPAIDNAFIVNIGDCLMRWTNDIYVSTPHRVLEPQRERRSIAFFLDPNPDALIARLPGCGTVDRYPPVLAADYLQSRLSATYGK